MGMRVQYNYSNCAHTDGLSFIGCLNDEDGIYLNF